MTAEEIKELYWRYYLSLEAQVVELERFIEFDLLVNGNTYSARLLELYQAICSEVDAIGKILAKECDEDPDSNLPHWMFFDFVVYNDIIAR